jgi:hypothetical protein
MQIRVPFFLLIIFIGAIIAAGCTSNGSNIMTPPTTTTPTSNLTSSPPVITLQPGWENFAVPEDNFSINVPMMWTVTENDAPTSSAYFLNTIKIENVKITPMQKILYLASSDSNESAIITGIEVANNDGSKSLNSNVLPQFLNAYIPALEQSMKEGAPTKEIGGSEYKNIINGANFESTVDPDVRQVNGYNAMRAGVNIADSNGNYIAYVQIVAVQSNNRIYIEDLCYINNAASDPTVQTLVISMLQSFSPTP